MVKMDRGLVERTANKITNRYGDEKLANMIMAYAEAYHGADIDSYALLEEILCDAYAGIDVFETELKSSEVYGGATQFTEEAVTGAVESYNARNALAKNNAGTDSYSRETTKEEGTSGDGGRIESVERFIDRTSKRGYTSIKVGRSGYAYKEPRLYNTSFSAEYAQKGFRKKE